MKLYSNNKSKSNHRVSSILDTSHSSSSSTAGGGGGGGDGPILYGLLFVSALYILVLWKTAQNLPVSSSNSRIGSWQVLHSVINPFVTEQNEQLDIQSLAYSTPFPQTIRSEAFETIQHPAARLVDPSPNNQPPPDLQVPPFWNPKDFLVYGGIRTYLGNYGSRLMTLQEAQSIGSFVSLSGSTTTLLPTIFIAIASYRDYQCPQTVTSIFMRAKYPQRIRVGVIDQLDFEQDTSCWTTLSSVDCTKKGQDRISDPVYCTYASQMDFYEMDATYAVGPVFARHLGHRLYRGEYFAGQIDAHVDFVQDWDEDIVNQWKSAKNEMAVLTTYLSDIEGSIDPVTFKSIRKTRPIMCDSDYEGGGLGKHLRHGQQPEGIAGIKGEPTLEPFWAAGFSFARGHFVVNVPYDQYLPMIFQGEEISLGLRAFSYGYDFYTPERSICFHYYAHGENGDKPSRKKIAMFWEHDALYRGVEVKAMKRLNGIIKIRKDDRSDWDHSEEKTYGAGQVRPVSLFYDVFGIHPNEERVEKNLCRFVGRNMHTIWKRALRKNTMGINYDEIEYRFKDPDIYGDTWSKLLKK